VLKQPVTRDFSVTELKELSTNLRHVRLLLAREKGNPDGALYLLWV
jgi:hypothetical protein